MDMLLKGHKSKLSWQSMLIAAILLSLLCRVLLILFPMWEETWKFTFNLACFALIGPVLGMTDIRKQWGMRILLAAFGWMVCTSLLHFSAYRDPELLMTYLLMAAVSIGLFYPAVAVLGENRGRKLFCSAAVLYVVCITAIAALTLFLSFSGLYIPSPGGIEAIGGGVFWHPTAGYRAYMFCNPIDGGLYCAISLVLIVLLWQDTKRRLAHVALIASATVLFIMLSLSDARGPSWALCGVMGITAFLLIQSRFTKFKLFPRFCISLATAIATTIACFALMRLTANLLKPLIPNLQQLRPVNYGIQNITGRADVWKAAFVMLRENPDVLWLGTGPMRAMLLVQPYVLNTPRIFSHPHSIILSILVTHGIPGLLLYAAFAVYIAYHSVRLFFFGGGSVAFSERAVPLLLVLCLIIDLVEAYLSFSGSGDHSNPWFFLASGYVVYLSKTRLPRKRKSGAPEANA